jgi:hypothetical protein
MGYRTIEATFQEKAGTGGLLSMIERFDHGDGVQERILTRRMVSSQTEAHEEAAKLANGADIVWKSLV